MRRVNINRVKAKIRQYRMQKHRTQNTMVEGNVNDYIKDLIALYNTKSQLSQTMVALPINIK